MVFAAGLTLAWSPIGQWVAQVVAYQWDYVRGRRAGWSTRDSSRSGRHCRLP